MNYLNLFNQYKFNLIRDMALRFCRWSYCKSKKIKDLALQINRWFLKLKLFSIRANRWYSKTFLEASLNAIKFLLLKKASIISQEQDKKLTGKPSKKIF